MVSIAIVKKLFSVAWRRKQAIFCPKRVQGSERFQRNSIIECDIYFVQKQMKFTLKPVEAWFRTLQ